MEKIDVKALNFNTDDDIVVIKVDQTKVPLDICINMLEDIENRTGHQTIGIPFIEGMDISILTNEQKYDMIETLGGKIDNESEWVIGQNKIWQEIFCKECGEHSPDDFFISQYCPCCGRKMINYEELIKRDKK